MNNFDVVLHSLMPILARRVKFMHGFFFTGMDFWLASFMSGSVCHIKKGNSTLKRWPHTLLCTQADRLGGAVLEVKRPIKNFQFPGKNANIWPQLFYHSISVYDITSIVKDSEKEQTMHNPPINEGSRHGSVSSTFDCELMCCRFKSHSQNWTFRLSPSG